MKVVFTHGYFINEDPKELEIMRPYVPLGILYISAWLQKNGRGVVIPYFGIANMSQTDSKTGGITNDYITQYQYGFYSEYGLHEKITIGGKFFLMQNVLVDNNYFFSRSIDANFGLDFAEFFTRGELFSTEKSIY